MYIARELNTGINHNMERGNKSWKRMAGFKCLGTMQTNQKCIYAKIHNKLNSKNPS